MTELHEKSAGGIVYRKIWSEIQVLMLAWKNAKNQLEYVLPKGHIEWEETAMETALREISEETGISINTLLSRKRYAIMALRKRLQVFYDDLTSA